MDLPQNQPQNQGLENQKQKQPGAVSNDQPSAASETAAGVEYATFGQRFLAALIDAFLFIALTLVVSLLFGGDSMSYSSNLVSLLSWFYFVFMDVKYGYTLGKKAIGLRVQNIDTGENLDWLQAILREVVGKFLSSLVLFLGYFWMLWDPKKQTWHDKLGKSVVVKAKN